jgi:hypothetical protein
MMVLQPLKPTGQVAVERIFDSSDEYLDGFYSIFSKSRNAFLIAQEPNY